MDAKTILLRILRATERCAQALESANTRKPDQAGNANAAEKVERLHVLIADGERRYSRDENGAIRFVFYPAWRFFENGRKGFVTLAVRQSVKEPELLADRFEEGTSLSVDGRIQSRVHDGKTYRTLWADVITVRPPHIGGEERAAVAADDDEEDVPF